MANLSYAKSFRDLLVYQKARQLAQEIFQVTTTFPKTEMFSLTDQIRRSSRSIGAQIAEAWAKRRYERHFLSKLTGMPMANNRKLNTGSKQPPTVGISLQIKLLNSGKSVKKSDGCLVE